MTADPSLPTVPRAPARSVRLWPGVVAVTLQWLAWIALPVVAPGVLGGYAPVFGGLIGAVAVLAWWAFASRAPHLDRWGVLAVTVVALAVTSRLTHPSVATGMMGLMLVIYAAPTVSLAVVASAVAARRLDPVPRRGVMAAAIVLACGGFTMVRSDGITGDGSAQLRWRWSETAEARFLAEVAPIEPEPPVARTSVEGSSRVATTPHPGGAPGPVPASRPTVRAEADAASHRAAPAPPAAWPGFRGPGRDGLVRGVRIAADWSASPPVELWRRPVGPAVSSVAVWGDLLVTQEQHGDDEVVAAYTVSTGAPVWRHHDPLRFWDSHAGPGPRSTPTIADGRVYTLGATGVLNVLDAADGTRVWTRDAAADAGTTIPGWGYAGSPLVAGDVVVAALAGTLIAYDRVTGVVRWVGPDGGSGYSSPHLMTLDGVTQVVLTSETGIVGVAPAEGQVLWEYRWPRSGRIVQPALTVEGDLLLDTGDGGALRRLAVTRHAGAWTVMERWTSTGLKPYFNDYVVHAGHAYGFDGSILACVDLVDGARRWKGGRYGHGQLVLLPDQDLLLVLSEDGDLALVGATPEGYTEVARVPALDGKSWNHPVLLGDWLLVRNAEEMAAYRLARAGG